MLFSLDVLFPMDNNVLSKVFVHLLNDRYAKRQNYIQ